MRITDGRMTIELAEDDARVARIRALLFEQPGASHPIPTLWVACSDPQREVLVAIARYGEVSQDGLERELGVNGVGLRGRHGGLAKIAKRVGVEYPIRSTSGRRKSRRFSLDPE